MVVNVILESNSSLSVLQNFQRALEMEEALFQQYAKEKVIRHPQARSSSGAFCVCLSPHGTLGSPLQMEEAQGRGCTNVVPVQRMLLQPEVSDWGHICSVLGAHAYPRTRFPCRRPRHRHHGRALALGVDHPRETPGHASVSIGRIRSLVLVSKTVLGSPRLKLYGQEALPTRSQGFSALFRAVPAFRRGLSGVTGVPLL